MADISATSWSETDANNNTASPAGAPEGMNPSGVNDTMRANMGAIKRWYDHANLVGTTGGAANAYTLTYSVAPTAYVSGDGYVWKSNFTNNGPATLNVNGLGAVSLATNDGAALVGNEIQTGSMFSSFYDGSLFRLFGIWQQSASNPGYFAIPGGSLWVQFGSVAFAGANTAAVGFPKNFPNNCWVVLTGLAIAAGSGTALGTGVSGISVSGFAFNVDTAVTTTGYWIAIGN